MARPQTAREPWQALAVLLVATFMGMLDVFIVNVAGPRVQADLHASFGQLQLVVAGYTMAYSVGIVSGGRLGDAVGHRRAFLLGTGLFGLTSVGCALAPDATTLVVLRVAQGFGAAIMLPQVLALIQVLFPPQRRPTAIGCYGAVLGLGAVAGQVLGGGLLGWNPFGLGWRSIFLVNAPLCVLAMLGTLRAVPSVPGLRRARFDPVGMALLGAGLFALLDPVIRAGEAGWSAMDTAGLSLAAVLFASFGRWERRLAARGGSPLLPPDLFRQAGFTKGVGTALLFYSANTAFVLILSYFLQRGLHLSAWESALAFAPMAAVTGLASLALGPLRARYGRRVVVAGGVLALGGLLVTVPVATIGDAPALAWLLQPGLLVYGVGGGLIAPAIVGLSLAETAPENAGAASGGLLTATQAANAVGVAAIGAVFSAVHATSGSYPRAFVTSLWLLSGVFVGVIALLRTFRAGPDHAVAPGPDRTVVRTRSG